MRYSLAVTPRRFALMTSAVSERMERIGPFMKKFASRWQSSLRRNIRSGKGATGKPMAPLSPATLNSFVTEPDNWTIIGARKSLKGGSKPLFATGKTASKFSYTLVGKNGFVMFVNDEHRKMVSIANTKDRRWRAKNISAAQKTLVRKGIKASQKSVQRGWKIPARIPLALNSRKIKKSTKQLTAFIMEPIFKRLTR